MTQRAYQIMEVARSLSVPERLELIQAVSKSVAEDCTNKAPQPEFWVVRPLKETIPERAIPVVQDVSALAGSFWPEEETTEEFLGFLAEQRLADRLATT